MVKRCITNNPLIIKKGLMFIEAINGDTLSVLETVKKEITKGYKLITHPLTGSIRPDVNPYKTIIISQKKGEIDIESLNIIENALEYAYHLNLKKSIQVWDEKSLLDFQIVDYDLIKNSLI